jgi:hypothetical protein
MSAVSAFNWKEYTDQEHKRNGDPFADIKRSAEISAATTAGVHKLRNKKPTHGTIFGITEKNISTKAPDMMEMKNAKGKSTKRSQRAADRQ